MNRSHGKKYSPSRRNVRLKFIVLAAAVLVVLLGVYAAGRFLEEKDYQEERGQMSENFGLLPTREFDGKTYVRRPEVTTLLIMGVDREPGEEITGFRSGGQADFLTLVALDHVNKTVRQLQIDRNTMAEVKVLSVLGRSLGTRVLQICLSHGYGGTEEACCENTMDAVQNFLGGEEIELYVAVNLEAIQVVNRALGGVTVTLTDDFSHLDPEMTPGTTLRLNDAQAELFVRGRMEVGDGTNASRMRRQRAYVSSAVSIMRQKMSENIGFADTLFELLDTVTTCSNVQRGRLVNELNQAYKYDILPVETLTGEYTTGQSGYTEFHADPSSVAAWIKEALYEPKK